MEHSNSMESSFVLNFIYELGFMSRSMFFVSTITSSLINVSEAQFRSSINRVSSYPANIYLFRVNDRNMEKGVKMFKVSDEDTRTTSVTYFTPFSSVSIVDIEQVNFCWLVMSFTN